MKKLPGKRASKLTFSVVFSKEEQCYVGLCEEYPRLSWLHESKFQALRGIKKLVAEK